MLRKNVYKFSKKSHDSCMAILCQSKIIFGVITDSTEHFLNPLSLEFETSNFVF